jgi:thioredoxin 1
MPLHAADADSWSKEVLQAPGTVLVDFWASWCGPCRQMHPILDRLEEAHAPELTVVKVNVDDFPEAAASHQIRSIPTLVVYRAGAEQARLVGAHSFDRLDTEIRQHLPH